jgi:hypothetical protein
MKKEPLANMIKIVLAPKTPASLQTILAADAHLAEGQFLHEVQTLNEPSRKSKTSSFQNRRAEFRTKLNSNNESSIDVVPPFT